MRVSMKALAKDLEGRMVAAAEAAMEAAAVEFIRDNLEKYIATTKTEPAGGKQK